jgi:hypothetical protein
VLYFAYGSNMAVADGFVRPARLDGYRLALTRRSIRWRAGVLDIVEADGRHVWGALFDLPDLERLDAKEAAGVSYRRVEVELDGGERAVAYEVIHKEPEPVPTCSEYAELVLAGARECGLSDEWQAELREVLGP